METDPKLKLLIVSYQAIGALFDGSRALRVAAHGEAGDAQQGGFFLNSA